MNKNLLFACIFSPFALSLMASDFDLEPLIEYQPEKSALKNVDAAYYDNLAYEFANGELPARQNLFAEDSLGERNARRDRVCSVFSKHDDQYAQPLGKFVLYFLSRHGSFVGHREGQVRLRRSTNFIKTSLPLLLKEILWEKGLVFKFSDQSLKAQDTNERTYSIKRAKDYTRYRLLLEIKEKDGTTFYGSCQ